MEPAGEQVALRGFYDAGPVIVPALGFEDGGEPKKRFGGSDVEGSGPNDEKHPVKNELDPRRGTEELHELRKSRDEDRGERLG